MDLLSDILLSLSIDEVNIADFRLTAPWGIHTRGFSPGFSLFVMKGECFVTLPDGAMARMTAGDSLTLPRGGDIEYASSPHGSVSALTAVWGERDFQALSNRPAAFHRKYWGGGGEPCAIMGMAFEASETAEEQILADLPDAILLQTESSVSRLIAAFCEDLQHAADPRPGEFAQRTRIVEGIIIGILRQHLETSHDQSGWLAGINDAALRPALHAIHKHFEKAWTLASLARHCSMSRSSFSRRFRATIGSTPLTYLNAWRARQANRLLRNSDRRVSDIAHAVGFANEHTLRRHLRRAFEKSPREIRREHARRTERREHRIKHSPLETDP